MPSKPGQHPLTVRQRVSPGLTPAHPTHSPVGSLLLPDEELDLERLLPLDDELDLEREEQAASASASVWYGPNSRYPP